jgi:hypothetical protein
MIGVRGRPCAQEDRNPELIFAYGAPYREGNLSDRGWIAERGVVIEALSVLRPLSGATDEAR